MLADVTRFLRCPLCRGGLRHGGSALLCAGGHCFDIARQGYVNLLTGRPGRRDTDTASMVGARARFLAGGHFEQLAGLLAARSREAMTPIPGDACVLDVGAGTGYYLARILDGGTGQPGIAVDASKHAARRAARAHSRIGAVVTDAWQEFPVRSGVVGVAVVVFAPRNPAELYRVLNGRGQLIVVTPAPGHLREVIEPLGLLRIPGSKEQQLSAQFGQFFRLTGQEAMERRLHLDQEDLRSVAMMGPSAWHVQPETLDQRIGSLGAAADVTAAFTISAYLPRAASAAAEPRTQE